VKYDLGILKFEVPDDDLFVPSVFVGLGKEEKHEPLTAGPTMAKTKTVRYRRTLAMYFGQLPAEMEAATVLDQGLGDVQRRLGGKVANVEDKQLNGFPAKRAFVQHLLEGTQMVSHILVTIQGRHLWSIMLSALDNPKTRKDVQARFDALLGSLTPGVLIKMAESGAAKKV
jgi:hypothetical protein